MNISLNVSFIWNEIRYNLYFPIRCKNHLKSEILKIITTVMVTYSKKKSPSQFKSTIKENYRENPLEIPREIRTILKNNRLLVRVRKRAKFYYFLNFELMIFEISELNFFVVTFPRMSETCRKKIQLKIRRIFFSICKLCFWFCEVYSI